MDKVSNRIINYILELHSRTIFILSFGSILLYLFVLLVLFPYFGTSVYFFMFIPALVISGFYGKKASRISIIGLTILTIWFHYYSNQSISDFIFQILILSFIIYLVAFTLATLRDIYIQFKKELENNKRIESEYLKKQQALIDSEQRMSSIYNYASMGFFRTTATGRIIIANQAYIYMLGYSNLEDIINSNTDLAFHQSFHNHYFIDRLNNFNIIKGFENEWKTKYDHKIFVRETTWAVKNKDGDIIFYDGVVEDISEKKIAEYDLKSSEERFRSLFENATVGFFRRNPNGRIIMANPAFINMLKSLTFKQMAIFNPENEESEYIFKNSKFVSTLEFKNKISGFETEFTLADNSRLVISETAWRVKNTIGDTAFYEGIVEDITLRKNAEENASKYMIQLEKEIAERKNAQATLAQSQEKYRDLVEKTRIAILVDNLEGQFVFYNQRFADLFGYDYNELIAKSYDFIVYKDDLDLVKQYHFNRVSNINSTPRYEFRGVRKDGYLVYLEADVVLETENSIVTGTHAYLWDITERKKYEIEREKLVQDLTKAVTEIKTLSGLLPICSNCKSIRDDTGYWHDIESYIDTHSEAQFSHGLCPKCLKKLYPDYYEEEES